MIAMKVIMAIAFVVLWGWSEAGVAGGADSGNVTTYEEAEAMGLEGVKAHSRRRRYIVFPKGSSLQLILELLVHVPTQFQVLIGPTLQVAWPLPSDPLECFRNISTGEALAGNRHKVLSDLATLLDSFGMTIGLAWQLPDDPMIYSEFKKKHKIYKRNVFKKMESFMSEPWGADGRQCVLRALCESGQRTPSKKEFLTEILHTIFSVEAKDLDVEEEHEDKVYRKAHQSVNQNCQTLYPKCHFSLFDSV